MNSIIITTLAPMGIPVVPDVYTGTEDTYITFNYASNGMGYADNAPGHERYLIQIHYFCPLKENSILAKNQIKTYLFLADFLWPSMTDATDMDGQHWVFETEYLKGV